MNITGLSTWAIHRLIGVLFYYAWSEHDQSEDMIDKHVYNCARFTIVAGICSLMYYTRQPHSFNLSVCLLICRIHHIDLYRLDTEEEIKALKLEQAFEHGMHHLLVTLMHFICQVLYSYYSTSIFYGVDRCLLHRMVRTHGLLVPKRVFRNTIRKNRYEKHIHDALYIPCIKVSLFTLVSFFLLIDLSLDDNNTRTIHISSKGDSWKERIEKWKEGLKTERK